MIKRPPAVAGQFYPADPVQLRQQIEKMFSDAGTEAEGEIYGFICPHAGYVFSGSVAAKAYHLLEKIDNLESVVLVGPSHRESFSFASVLTDGYYETPLGKARIDHELAQEIVESGSSLDYEIKSSDRGHKSGGMFGEHCLEVQVPFLQVALPDVKIVPIIMGTQAYKAARDLGKAIADAARGKRIVVIASSDLSHYLSVSEAMKLDQEVINEVTAFNPQSLADAFQSRKAQACGAGPMMAIMTASRLMGADSARLLEYKTSADSPYGDSNRVVGYMSAIFEKKVSAKTEDHGKNVHAKL
ncbi:MAG: AmmeMemoRadiSam system protein B [Candidatus Electryonea clarkiae]|nr:AmmeMemoRadiSam system protein B [Candidatus Electryonea clarkiae]MDP8286029.1 AmmeMemoRadiSam system protein B [Candidatus Electryonea clarkiae]